MMNKKIFIFIFIFLNLNIIFAKCLYVDCTPSVISNSKTFINKMQKYFKHINYEIDKLDKKYSKWSDKVQEQEAHIKKVEDLAYEYYIILKQIKEVKAKTLYYKLKLTK